MSSYLNFEVIYNWVKLNYLIKYSFPFLLRKNRIINSLYDQVYVFPIIKTCIIGNLIMYNLKTNFHDCLTFIIVSNCIQSKYMFNTLNSINISIKVTEIKKKKSEINCGIGVTKFRVPLFGQTWKDKELASYVKILRKANHRGQPAALLIPLLSSYIKLLWKYQQKIFTSSRHQGIPKSSSKSLTASETIAIPASGSEMKRSHPHS